MSYPACGWRHGEAPLIAHNGKSRSADYAALLVSDRLSGNEKVVSPRSLCNGGCTSASVSKYITMDEIFDFEEKNDIIITSDIPRCIEVFNSQFPDEEEETLTSAAHMLKALHGLPEWVAFNVAFINGKVRIFFSTVRNQTIAVDDAIFSNYLYSEVRRVKNPIVDSKISYAIELWPFSKNIAYQYLMTLRDFKEADPLAHLTNAVWNERGEDAIIQIVFKGIRNEKWRQIIARYEARKIKDPQGVGIARLIAPGFFGADMLGRTPTPPTVQKELRDIGSKKEDLAFTVNINVGAETEERAMDLTYVMDIFAQMNWLEPKVKKDKGLLISPDVKDRKILLVSSELASIVHLPSKKVKTPTIETTSVRVLNIPTILDDGIHIFDSYLRGKRFPVRVTERDLTTHYTILGSTGTGKTTILVNAAKAFMEHGFGLAVVDPQDGRLLRRIVEVARQTGRENDIVWFNPFNNDKVITLNPLAPWDGFDPESLAALLTDAFYRVWRSSWGPRLEYLLHMALLSFAFLNRKEQMANPGNPYYRTLEDIFYLYLDKHKFDMMVDELTSYGFESISKEISTVTELLQKGRQWSDVISPILNKLGVFTLNKGVNRVFNSGKSSVDLREIIRDNRILLIDLKTRKAKDIARVIGNVLLALIYQALQETVEHREGVYGLFLDEAHNFAGEALSTMIQEGRQIGVSIFAVTQFIGSLLTDSIEETQKIREAFLAVPRNFIQFGTNDVPDEVLEKFGRDFFTKADFNKLPRFHAYGIVSVNGKPEGPTVITAHPITDEKKVAEIKEEDYYTHYHVPVAEIDEEVQRQKEILKKRFEEIETDMREKLLSILSKEINETQDEEVQNIMVFLKARIAEGMKLWDEVLWALIKQEIAEKKYVFRGNKAPVFGQEDMEFAIIASGIEAPKATAKLKQWVTDKIQNSRMALNNSSLWKGISTILKGTDIGKNINLKESLEILAKKEELRKKAEALKKKVDVDDSAIKLDDFI